MIASETAEKSVQCATRSLGQLSYKLSFIQQIKCLFIYIQIYIYTYKAMLKVDSMSQQMRAREPASEREKNNGMKFASIYTV